MGVRGVNNVEVLPDERAGRGLERDLWKRALRVRVSVLAVRAAIRDVGADVQQGDDDTERKGELQHLRGWSTQRMSPMDLQTFYTSRFRRIAGAGAQSSCRRPYTLV